ncbi:hypothetical protein DYB36_006449 [Aphanomyces astaci]|uniref:Uncharacterized protein n=1 Tax=Aphanomyces astaci TaxID=112090 RepID=A0A396ZW37_APHAT|nr:hypothetical protein DYB36_006449 [Aphanomyces astaci]
MANKPTTVDATSAIFGGIIVGGAVEPTSPSAAVTPDEAWNIMEDLEFLIATDNDLHDEFSHVCELLDDSFPIDDILPSSSSSSELITEAIVSDSTSKDATSPLSTATAGSPQEQTLLLVPQHPHRRKRVNHQKEEIRFLQKQVVALQAKLVHDKKCAASAFNMTAWEAAARHERVEKRRAIIENQHLYASVAEGSMFIQHMQSMMRKKPRWTTSLAEAGGVDDWQQYKLAAQANLRAAAIHAIADRQFRRQTNAFILAQVVGQTHDLFRATPKTLASGQVVLEVVNHTTLKLPYRIAMNAVWRTFRGDLGPMLLDEACSERFSQRRSGADSSVLFTNTILKLYQEHDRDVLVFRSVLEDELEPHMTRRSVDDMAGWLVTTADSKLTNQCGLTSVIHMPLASKVEVHGLVHALQTFSFGPMSDTAVPVVRDREAFFQRAKMFDTAMKGALHEATTEFYATSVQK